MALREAPPAPIPSFRTAGSGIPARATHRLSFPVLPRRPTARDGRTSELHGVHHRAADQEQGHPRDPRGCRYLGTAGHGRRLPRPDPHRHPLRRRAGPDHPHPECDGRRRPRNQRTSASARTTSSCRPPTARRRRDPHRGPLRPSAGHQRRRQHHPLLGHLDRRRVGTRHAGPPVRQRRAVGVAQRDDRSRRHGPRGRQHQAPTAQGRFPAPAQGRTSRRSRCRGPPEAGVNLGRTTRSSPLSGQLSPSTTGSS